MFNQAEKLRRLVTRSSFAGRPQDHGSKLLAISGGRQGAGATTVAVNLALTLASDALRVVLVDADFSQPGIAARCGIADAIGIGDILAGRKSVHEAIQRGPAGLQVVAGLRAGESLGSLPERVSQRVLRQLQSLGPHADWVVIDCGQQSRSLIAEFWSSAHQVLLVTSPDAVAVMDSYSLIKTMLSSQKLAPPLGLVVNQADDEAAAADVYRRVEQSCRRFLEFSPEFAAALPHDPVAGVARGNALRASQSSPGPLAASIQQLAHQLIHANSLKLQRVAA